MKNIIVVTGGAGFVGSNLIELLVKKTKYSSLSSPESGFNIGDIRRDCNPQKLQVEKDDDIKTEVKTNLTRGPRGRDYRFVVDDLSSYSSQINSSTTLKNTSKPSEIITEKKDTVVTVVKKATPEELVKKTKKPLK